MFKNIRAIANTVKNGAVNFVKNTINKMRAMIANAKNMNERMHNAIDRKRKSSAMFNSMVMITGVYARSLFFAIVVYAAILAVVVVIELIAAIILASKN